MKNKVCLWKCTFFLMIFILLFSCLVLSQGESGSTELTPEQFNQLPNPTAEDLAKVQNPTLENFNKLMPEQQGSYLLQNYNNEFAVTFYKAIDNVGKNPELDKKYFSGKEISGGSRATISQSKEAAGKYFKEEFKNSYNFDSLGNDFVFDPDKETLNNFGKIISLEEFRDRPEVKSITAVADGFLIELEKSPAPESTAPAQKSKVSIGGTGAGMVSYKDKEITLTDSAGKKNSFHDFGESTSIKVTSDGYSVDGRATGSVMVGDKLIQFNNRRGALSLGAEKDGTLSFASENAEIFSDEFYFDGAGEKKGKEAVVWGHGDTQKGNLRGTNSVFIDRSTGVGVVSQGQSGLVDAKGNREAIFIHLGEDTSPEAGAAAVPEQSAKELRAQALALQPAKGDLGNRGEVSIKKNAQGETIVTAKGKVEVGFYGKDQKSRGLLAGMPFFKGTNGKSEYELKTDGEINGETEVKVRGQAVYMDRYYGTTVLKDGNVEVGEGNGGIHPLQDGASLSIARKANSDTDLVTSTCFECTAGKVMTIGKNIFAGNAVGADGAAVLLTETVPFNIEVAVDDKGGFSYNTNPADAGKIAELQSGGKVVALGKMLDLRTIDPQNPETGPKHSLRLAKPSEGGSLVAYLETFQNGKVIEGSRRQLDFGIKDALGDAVILTSEKNSQSVAEMNRLLEEGKISELSQLEFEDDPQLRKFILDQNGIDIEHINNPEYLKKVEAATKSQDEFENWKAKIENKYGIQLDDNGACIAPPGCELKIQKAIQKADKLGYWYTQAKVKALDAQGKMLDAIIATEADGGEASGAKAAKSALLEEKKQIVQARKYLLGVAEQKKKEEERKKEEAAQEYQALVDEYDSVEREYEQNLAEEKAASQRASEEWARIEEEAREGEKAYLQQKAEADRVQAISEGVPPSYESQVSLADESAIEELRREKVKLEVLRGQIELNNKGALEQAQKERDAEVEKLTAKKISLAVSPYETEYGSTLSDEKYQEIVAQARAEAEAEAKGPSWLKLNQENYEKQINGLNKEIQRIDSETEALVSDYLYDRPDYAAELAIRAGHPELARNIAETEVASVSIARADQLTAEAYAQDRDFDAAAESAQAVIDNPDASAVSIQSAEAIKKEHERLAYNTARRELEGRQFAVDVDIANQRARDKEEAEGSFLGYLNFWSIYTGQYATQAVAAPISDVKWSDPTYLETKEIQKERGMNAMRQESESLNQAINLLNQKEANGLDSETGLHELSQKYAADSTVANTVQYAADTALGKEVDPEIAAAVELGQIQRRIALNGGDVYQARAELEALHEKYLGTKAADTARNKVKELDQVYGLLTVGALEEWRETAISVSSVDNFIPIGAVAKVGGKAITAGAKAAAATKLVQGVAKSAQAATTAVKTTKAFGKTAEVTAKAAAPVMRGASKVSEVASKAGKVVLWESSSVKAVKAAEGAVATAEGGVKLAKEIGDAGLIANAEQKAALAVKSLEDAKAVVEAEQVAKAGTIAGIKYNLNIGLTKSERTAIGKLDVATEAFRTAQKTGSAQLGEKAADVLAASKKVEDARLSNLITKKVSSAFSTRFGAKAADDVVKQVDSLEEMGAVLKPTSEKVVVDTSGVSPALKPQAEVKAAELRQAIKSADVDEAKIAQEALEEVNKVPISSESSAGKAVMGELAGQKKAADEMSAVIPFPSKSAAASAKEAAPIKASVKAAEPIDLLAYKADQIEEEAVRNTVGNLAAAENAKKVAAANDALPVVNKKLAAQRALKASAGNKKSSMQVLEDAIGDQSLAAKFDNRVTGGVKARSLPETLPGSESFIAEESLINDEIVSLELSSKTEPSKLALVPKAKVENVDKIKTGQGGVVALGDLHGTKTGVLDDLNGVGTRFEKQRITGDGSNPDSWHWTGRDDVVVQVGDIYDRGDDAFVLREAFNHLDDEARAAGGRVIRLAGNHELAYLQKKMISGIDVKNYDWIRSQILEDVSQGRLFAATAVDGELYTHAGVSLRKFPEWKGQTAEEIAENINTRFRYALSKNDFSDPIFDVGRDSGGKAEQGGIFWLRSDTVADNDFNLGYRQFRGHDAISREEFTPNIKINEQNNVVDLDVGRSEYYGGGKGAFYNAPNAVKEILPAPETIPEIISEIPPAAKLKDNLYGLDNLRYEYNSKTRGWEQKGGWFSKNKPTEDLDITSRLEASRLEVPVPVAAESFRSFESITTRLDDGTMVVKPESLEKWTLDLADEIGDASTLTTDKIKELVLNRARASGMHAGQLEALSKNFDKLYQQSVTIGSDIAEFSEKLAKVDDGRGFTNVHLFRDGSILGASDAHFQKLSGKAQNVRIIYVSRDTTLSSKTITKFKGASSIVDHAETNKVGTLMFNAYHKAGQSSNLDDKARFVIFREEFQKEFTQLMETDSEFREVAERTYLYLQEQGLLKKGAKLRFVDTCCTGSINYFLEGIVRYYEPSIEIESLLMNSEIRYLSAGFKKAGFNAEQLSKPVNPAFKYDPQTGGPLMELSTSKEYPGYDFYGPVTDQVLSYLDELAVLQQTAEKAKASSLTAVPK